MKLTPQDIESHEKVGDLGDKEIWHILTKGGCHYIVKKQRSGSMDVLATGPHRSIARHGAEQVEKNIKWNDVLFKSEPSVLKKDDPAQNPKTISMPQQEHPKDHMGNPMYESNPQNHYDLAAFHSKKSGKHFNIENEARGHHEKLDKEIMQPHLAGQGTNALEDMPPEYQQQRGKFRELYNNLNNRISSAKLMQLVHTDSALRNYQMAGMNPKQAMEEHKKQMALHNELPHDAQPPFQEDAMNKAWERTNPGKKMPDGLSGIHLANN